MSSRPTATRVVKYIRKGVADCHLIKAVSYSAYANSSGTYAIKDASKVTFDDTTVLEVTSRGITMLLLNATTGAKLYQNTFDTYDDSDTYSPKLVSALSSYKATANAVLVLVSRDAITLTSDVITALQDYGCGEVDAVTEPSRAAFAFIGQGGVPAGHAYYELRNYENAEVSLQASVTNGALIQRGADGADAVTIQASGENIVFTKVGQVAYVYVDAYKGQVRIAYQDDFYCSAFDSYLFDKSVYWRFSTANNRFFYIFKLLKKADLDEELTYTATVNGVAYKRTIHIKTVYDGENGDRGPALRGPQAWNDCAVGYSFQSGADGEEYKDVVLYNSNYYSCIASHTKTADNYPTSTLDTNNGYWKLADKFEIIATNILLAQYALVKNLGVEAIDMKDSAGNILFQAKDGNVICNTGTFKNVKVSGELDAVTGSFRSLKCSNDDDGEAGISFSNGHLTFEGDMYSQGYSSKKSRGWRFYASDIWCRGSFGAAERNTMVVKGTYAYYYTNGVSKAGVHVALTSKTSSNSTKYYTLDCYGSSGDYSGFPVDTIIFNISSSTTYNYLLSACFSQRLLLVNGNDDKNNVQFYSNGGLLALNGGCYRQVVQVNPDFLSPTIDKNTLGLGLLVGAMNDNNW